MMESRASGANRLHGLLRTTRVIGFSQTPVLPIVPSVDQSHCSSRQEAFSLASRPLLGSRWPGFVVGPTPPYSPDNAGHLVGQGYGRFVVATGLFQSQCPGSEPIGLLEAPGSKQCRPGSVDDQHSQVGVSPFADRPQPASLAAGALSGCEAKEAREVTTCGETLDVSYEGDERCGGDQPDAGNREQLLDGRGLLGQKFELLFDCADALLEVSNLQACLSQGQAQWIRQLVLSVLQQSPGLGDYLLRADGQEMAELAQDAPHQVDPGGAIGEPCRTQAMKGGKGLLGNGLDRDGSDRLVSMRFEQALGVGLVGLVATHVGLDLAGRQQEDLVAAALDFPCPEVSTTTGLEQDKSRLVPGKEAQKLGAAETVGFGHLAGVAGNRHLEHVLCQIDRDRRRLHSGLLLSVHTGDSGTKMPAESPGGVHSITCTRTVGFAVRR